MADLTLDQCRKLAGGDRVRVTWADGWQDKAEEYSCTWRGGLLWAVNSHGVQERVICWKAEAKPDEILKHKVTRVA